LKKNKNLLKEIAKGQSSEEVVIKANVVRASILNNGQTLELDGIGQLARKKRSLYDVFTKIPVGPGNHNGTISYVDFDQATTVKAAAAVAEGAAFPQSTAKFEYFTLPLRKLGDTLPVSEEFFEDEVQAAAELELFLATNVEDLIDTQIVQGDNTGQNLKGLVSSTPAYVPVASGISDANIYDLVAKVSEAITSTGGAKYTVDFVAMNISDINKLKLKKDANNNYVFDFNDPRIGSINIIEDNNVPANTMFVGDGRYARIYEIAGVVISKGMVNAQFTEDFMTIKARKRILFLIRNIDQSGFRKVTSISAALVTLAT
jgi:HK97 family phage major capsid protein